jgi:hypothetical protein
VSGAWRLMVGPGLRRQAAILCRATQGGRKIEGVVCTSPPRKPLQAAALLNLSLNPASLDLYLVGYSEAKQPIARCLAIL